jgi:hypothetical protein
LQFSNGLVTDESDSRRTARCDARSTVHFVETMPVTPPFFSRLAATAGLGATLLLTAAPWPAHATLANDGLFRGPDHERAVGRPPSDAVRWYDRFHDDTLSALVRSAAARAATGEPEAAVASAYVVARTTALRRLLLADAQATLFRERQFVGASAPVKTSAAALARVDAALTTSREHGTSLAFGFRESVSRLAALCGSAPDAIEALLLRSTPTLPTLPVFDTTSIAKPEVGTDRGLTAADLLQIERLTADADRAEQLAKARENEFRATELRSRLGSASEMDVIVAYRRLLIVDDALAVAGAQLALGWIGLVRKAGSASLGIEPRDLPVSAQQR